MTIFRSAVAICLTLAFAMSAAWAENNFEPGTGYNTIVDEQNNIILETGLPVEAGDQFITDDNRMFEISSIEGTLARARFKYVEYTSSETPAIPAQAVLLTDQADARPKMLIGIYHTDTDESYIPTDGTGTGPGNGGVTEVGRVFAERLQALGYRTEHDKTLHDPHDGDSYQHSRPTLASLLTHQPAALFDIHRDSAPKRLYDIEINGQPTAKILLVVGRQNQNRQTIFEYAKTIKNAADTKYPRLIRGIFITHGNYNQDLSPHSMLLEIGTQFSSRSSADRSAALFADLIPSFLGGPESLPPIAGTTQKPSKMDTPETLATLMPTAAPSPYTRSSFWIIGAFTAGLAAYLLFSPEGWRETKGKLKHFVRIEFTSFLGARRRRK